MQSQHTKTSSITTRPSSGRLASTERSLITKTAPRKFSATESRVSSSTKPTTKSSLSAWNICPLCLVPGCDKTVRFKRVCEFFHLRNLRKASLEEAIFLHVLYAQLATNAKMLAAILPWSVQRPLRDLLSVMHGENLTTKSRPKSTHDLKYRLPSRA